MKENINKKIVNVVMAIDEKFIMPTRTTIASIKANKKDENINIYILHFNISNNGIQLLESDSTGNVKINCIQINSNTIPNIKEYYHFSKEIMIKLFVHEFLDKKINKVIWVDSDVIVLDSLCEFYDYDISNHYFVAYKDQKVKDSYLSKIGFDVNKDYLCVGFMLINLEAIRKDKKYRDSIEKYIENNYNVIEYAEQDAINTLFYDKSVILGYPFRFDRFVDMVHSKEIKEQNISVIHYEGPHQKPWKGCACRHYNLWWKYAKTIKEYIPLYWKVFPTYVKNFVKKIFVKLAIVVGLKKKKK